MSGKKREREGPEVRKDGKLPSGDKGDKTLLLKKKNGSRAESRE